VSFVTRAQHLVRRVRHGRTGGLRAVRVVGPFHGPTGYDHHVREFVRELHRQGVAIELVDLPNWGPGRLPPDRLDPWFDTLDQPVGAPVDLHFCMPHQVVARPGVATVNYTMFEATRVHPRWITENRLHDLVVVPTESSQRAWIASGMPAERLAVSPLGVNTGMFGKQVPPLALHDTRGAPISRYRVRFLNVSELGPRKNLPGLLRAWLVATQPDDDAVLIVKLGSYRPGAYKAFQESLDALQGELRTSLDGAAPVLFMTTVLADAEMPRLFAAATHYISMSFGEGWDQAMVEAAASGLRLIAPRHSAYEAYLDDAVARLITSREAPVHRWIPAQENPLFDGASWWEPDLDEACRAIRAAIDRCDQPTASARERVLSGMTWTHATQSLIPLLERAAAGRRG